MALASNNQFIIKLVKMWSGGASHVVVRTLKKETGLGFRFRISVRARVRVKYTGWDKWVGH